MMWYVLFAALILLIIFMESKEDVKVTEEADVVTVEIKNIASGEINIILEY